jgi:TonB family protein
VAPVPLQPTSKWNVEYDTAQCIASRNYGTEEKPLLLILKPSPLFGKVMRVMVLRDGGYFGSADEVQASIQFDDSPKIRASGLKATSKGNKQTVFSFNVPTDEFRTRAQAKTVTVATNGLDVTFALTSVPGLLAELEKCRLNLLQEYHSGGAGTRQGATALKPLSSISSPKDYPFPRSTYYNQGTVTVSVLVDEKGKVRDCSIVDSAGAATLDAMSCYVLQERASFRPAIGDDGKPSRSIFIQRITWRLEK